MLITINEEEIEVVTNVNVSETTFFALYDMINYNDFLVQSDVWNTDVKILEYEIRCTHAQKWFIEQLAHECEIIRIHDYVTEEKFNGWLNKTKFTYDSNDLDYPFKGTLTILKFKDIVLNYMGFELVKFDDNFERFYL